MIDEDINTLFLEYKELLVYANCEKIKYICWYAIRVMKILPQKFSELVSLHP